MKRVKISARLFVAAAFAVCVSCASGPSGGGEETPEEGFFSISMAIDNGRPSSRGNIVETPGTLSENHVLDTSVILFGKKDNVARYVFNFTVRITEDGTAFEEYHIDNGHSPPIVTGTPEGSEKFLYSYDGNKGFVTWARKVAKEEYNMMVLINTPGEGSGEAGDLNTDVYKNAALADITRPMNIEPFTMGYFGVSSAQSHYYGITAENFFFMSNHQGLVPITTDNIKDSVDEANNNPVEVSVSRGAAKISLNTMYPTSVTNGASVVFLDWELDVMNRFMYPLRKLTNLMRDGGGKGAPEAPGDGSLRKNQYAEDPNFTGFSYISGASDAQREAQFAYSYKKSMVQGDVIYDKFHENYGAGLSLAAYLPGTAPDMTPELGYAYNRSAQPAPVYCLENTCDITEQNPEVMTAVLVRAKYAPSGFLEDESYFVFNSRYVTIAQMAGFADDPSSISSDTDMDGLETAMTAAGLTGSEVVNGLTASFDVEGLSYYHQGINYYRIPIRHHTDETLNPAEGDYYGYYGVVRNNHYNITIGRVVGPGKPTVKPDPEVSLQPVITLMGWNEKVLNYDL